MTVILYEGYYYLLDAQTGEILGPFQTPDEVHRAAKKFLEDEYQAEFYRFDPYYRHYWAEPGWRLPLTEPKPWWEDEDMLQHFGDCFGTNPSRYIPPDEPYFDCQ
jgi:hypothetical protein